MFTNRIYPGKTILIFKKSLKASKKTDAFKVLFLTTEKCLFIYLFIKELKIEM